MALIEAGFKVPLRTVSLHAQSCQQCGSRQLAVQVR